MRLYREYRLEKELHRELQQEEEAFFGKEVVIVYETDRIAQRMKAAARFLVLLLMLLGTAAGIGALVLFEISKGGPYIV